MRKSIPSAADFYAEFLHHTKHGTQDQVRRIAHALGEKGYRGCMQLHPRSINHEFCLVRPWVVESGAATPFSGLRLVAVIQKVIESVVMLKEPVKVSGIHGGLYTSHYSFTLPIKLGGGLLAETMHVEIPPGSGNCADVSHLISSAAFDFPLPAWLPGPA